MMTTPRAWGCDNKPLNAQTAMLLVHSQFPSWGKAINPPASNRMVGDYYDATRAHAKPFLLFGRMKRPLATQAAGHAPIIQSARNHWAGAVGVFAVNTKNDEATVEVPMPGAGPWRATFYVCGSQQHTKTVAGGGTLQWQLPFGRLASFVFTPGQ